MITRPMSFSSMREKVRNREYRTWGAFNCDFELICANAVVYNQQKSKVHKAAKTMLRQGKIDLQVGAVIPNVPFTFGSNKCKFRKQNRRALVCTICVVCD